MLHLMMIPRGATDQIGVKIKRTVESGPAPVSVGCIKNTTTNVAIGINGITGVGHRQGYMLGAGRGVLTDRIERLLFASQAL